MPVKRAAASVPPNLPAVATSTINPQIIHSDGDDRSPISVLMPVNAKKAGSRRIVTRSWSFSLRAVASRLSCGTTAPKRNAPNTA